MVALNINLIFFSSDDDDDSDPTQVRFNEQAKPKSVKT